MLYLWYTTTFFPFDKFFFFFFGLMILTWDIWDRVEEQMHKIYISNPRKLKVVSIASWTWGFNYQF